MAVKKYIPIRGVKTHLAILLEVQLLKKYFPFLKTQIIDRKLLCFGYFQPSEFSITYHYKIEWEPEQAPQVFIESPTIDYNDDIHMYTDGSLCLYYPRDFKYNNKSHIYETIIPWTHEWFIFYELYLIKGRWLHPYVEHKKI